MAGRISFPKSQRQEEERQADLARQTMTSSCLYCGKSKTGTFKACRAWFRRHACKERAAALAEV